MAETEAIAFNPFDDDDDEDEYGGTELQALIDNLAGLDYPATMATMATMAQPNADDAPGATADPSAKYRKIALEEFRKRRTDSRSGRIVADGMVTLPFVPLTDPLTACVDPTTFTGVEPPTLHKGDVVAGQYDVKGVLAHGGLGWIYLAQDRNVSGRWVVLKGMRGDAKAEDKGAAVAEREFLADITHPEIVRIYNFVDDPRVEDGFIVMEYVGGPSLKERRKTYENRLYPADLAIGYILELLPALGYLHSRGVVYNDVKPSNIILTEDQVKLIDLGAVSGIGAYGYIYGTKGFAAPEVPTEGPSIASDIYSIGRTLASLIVDMPKGDDGRYLPGIPSPKNEPLFRRHLSLYRLLQRATNPDPSKRMASVDELSTQLYGVLREIRAVRDHTFFPAQHSMFSPQRATFGTKHRIFRTDQLIDGINRTVYLTPQEIVSALPIPNIDSSDIGAPIINSAVYSEPAEELESMQQALQVEEYRSSREIPYNIVRILLNMGLTGEAQTWLTALEAELGTNWQIAWLSGITSLLLDNLPAAQRHFDTVLAILPGEAAPKLALAATDELILQRMGMARTPLLNDTITRAAAVLNQQMNDLKLEIMSDTWSHITTDPAALRFHTMRLYALVWMTNPTTVSSAFGLSRLLVVENQVELAVRVLDRLNASSRHHRMSKLTTIVTLISDDPTESRIRRAARRLEEIPTNEPRLMQVKVAVLSAALLFLRNHGLDAAASTNPLFEYPFTQTGIRTGLSTTLRALARTAPFARHRYTLVDLANAVRPSTTF